MRTSPDLAAKGGPTRSGAVLYSLVHSDTYRYEDELNHHSRERARSMPTVRVVSDGYATFSR